MATSLYAHYQGNWLVGIAGGFARHNGQYVLNMNYFPNAFLSPFFPLPLTNTTQEYRQYGPMWGLLGGYQISFQGWSLGAEFNLDWYDTDHDLFFPYADNRNTIIWDASERYERKASYGLSLKLGYAMSSYFEAFMRAGLEMSHDKLKAEIVSTNIIFDAVEFESKKRMRRYFAGVGAQTPLYASKLLGRIEYNVLLSLNHINSCAFIEDNFLNPAFNLETKPKTQLIKGSLIWNI